MIFCVCRTSIHAAIRRAKCLAFRMNAWICQKPLSAMGLPAWHTPACGICFSLRICFFRADNRHLLCAFVFLTEGHIVRMGTNARTGHELLRRKAHAFTIVHDLKSFAERDKCWTSSSDAALSRRACDNGMRRCVGLRHLSHGCAHPYPAVESMTIASGAFFSGPTTGIFSAFV